jgi:hypothetical protein
MYGPLSQDGVGSENILDGNYLTKVENNGHGHHLTTSSLFDNGLKVSINSNTEITGSFLTTGTIVSQTTPLVSGSSQIQITGTTGYSTFSSSLESTYLHIEGDGVYSSSAQITGNIYTPGSSFTIQDLVLGAGTTFGKITTDGSKYISVMPTYNVESARFWPNGNVTIQNGGDYVDNGFRLEVSGSARIVGDTQITGSLIVTGTVVSETTPLVSGSSQIEITGTTGYSTFSSSIALTNLTQSNRLDSIEGVTGSYATTGSNHFKQSQVITGSLIVTSFISGSLFNNIPISKGKGDLIDNVAIGEGALDANTTGYANTAVGFNVLSANQVGSINTAYGKNSLSSNIDGTFNTALGFGALSSNIGGGQNTAVGFNAGVGLSTPLVSGFNNIFVGSRSEGEAANESNRTWIGNTNTTTTWLGGELLLGTRTSTGGDFRATIVGNTQITGSAVITSNLTASLVSASFKGDGSQIYNVPASGVTGLQLNKIVNGSISASLENNALRVNTDVYIDGIITAREVHIDYVTSSVLYQSGSTKFGDTSDDTHQFTGSLSVSNTLIVSSSQITNKNVNGLSSGNQTISTTLTGSYTSAFCNYTVSSGSNARAGQIMVVWNGSSITYTDNSTTDIGLTKNVEFTASLNTGNVVISTVLPTNGWSIKTLMNLL